MSVQLHTPVNRELMIAARQGLLPAKGSGWTAGFGNMLAKELGEWFHTRRWLWQLLIWVAFVNGFTAIIFLILPAIVSFAPQAKPMIDPLVKAFSIMPLPEESIVFYFFTMLIWTGVFGVIIMAQDEIIQETVSGTAAWILSKPAARQGFILAKLLSNIIGILVFMIVIPGMVTQAEVYLVAHKIIPPVHFLLGCGVTALVLVFYLSIVIMLGVVFETRGKVLGITFGFYFVFTLAKNFVPQIAMAFPTAMDVTAVALALGQPLLPVQIGGVVAIAVLSIVFILVALWRFQHKEF